MNSFKNSNMCQWDWDIVQDKLHLTEDVFALLNIEKDKFSGFLTEFTKNIHHEDIQIVTKSLKDITDYYKPFQLEYRLVNNGNITHIYHQADVIFNDKDNPVHVVGRIQDITRQKESEERVNLLHQGINHTKEVVMIGTPNREILYVNDNFEKLFGYTKQELYNGLKIREIICDGQTELLKQINFAINNLSTFSGELKVQAKSGKRFYAEFDITPVKDEDGKTKNYINIIRDITEKKNLANKLNRAKRENDAFMRHELRNLFAPIKGYSDLLLNYRDLVDGNDISKEKINGWIQAINENSNRAISFINRLSVLNSFEFDNFELSTEITSLKSVIDLAITNLDHASEKYNIKIALLDVTSNDNVDIDLDLFQGVAHNLLKNAIEHVGNETHDQKNIKITIWNENGSVHFSINNKGKTVPPEKVKLFFDKFNTDKETKVDGTGLGTTYAYLVTKAHNGTIVVTSDDDNGTTIEVTLPLVKNPVAELAN